MMMQVFANSQKGVGVGIGGGGERKREIYTVGATEAWNSE